MPCQPFWNYDGLSSKIARYMLENGNVTTPLLQTKMQASKASVQHAVKDLREAGMIEHRGYGKRLPHARAPRILGLTPKGEELANRKKLEPEPEPDEKEEPTPSNFKGHGYGIGRVSSVFELGML